MHLRTNMKPSGAVYLYDGTPGGFYSAVYEAVYQKEMPADIVPESAAEPTLFDEKRIVTDENRAARVRDSVPGKISVRALELLETVYWSCLLQKELKMLRFLLFGYDTGKRACDCLGHDDVAPLLAAERHLLREVHLLKGFLRFSDYDGVLAAAIRPKNFALPFLARHFAGRYSGERFMIYDKTHGFALIYEGGKPEIHRMDHLRFPEIPEKEKEYRELWKQFYRTVSIEARENPRCRMTHMPKRYWENMVEMKEYL